MSDTLRINNLFTTAIGYSTLTGSTITTNSLSLSTLTVSSINSGAPGVAAYSTLNTSSLNTSSITTSSIITAPGYNSNIGNVLYASRADSGQTAANLTTASMPATVPAGSVISASYRLTAGASSGAAAMWLGSYAYTTGMTYNFTFTGMQGSQALVLYVYQYNAAGTDKVQISSNVYNITTSAATVSGSFTANLYPATYTGSIVFYFQAAAVNQYVNFTAFSMTTGSMNVGIGTTNPSSILDVRPVGTGDAPNYGISHYFPATYSATTYASQLVASLRFKWYNDLWDIAGIRGVNTSWQSLAIRYNGTEFITVGTGGLVGIGTTNPGYLLTVGAVANPTANSAGTTVIQCNGNLNIYRNRLIFSGTPTDWNHCIYNNSFNLDNEGAWDGMKFNVYNGAWFRVGTAVGSVPTTAMFINSTGQVGIGTTVPTSVLTVNNTGAYQTHHFIIRGQEYYNSGFSSTGIALNIGVNRSGNKQLWIMDPDLVINSSNTCLRIIPANGTTTINCLSTDGLTNMPLTISASSMNLGGGYVGIGTASPTQPLHIYQASGSSWSGRLIAGGSTNVFVAGEYNGAVSCGGHNFALNQWTAVSSGSTWAFMSSISKASGTFDIGHPLYPNTSKRLVHSFVEGPRCDLIYRGKTTLVNGSAVVDINKECTHSPECAMDDGTFEALCANPQIFLQNNQSFDRVRGAIAGCILTITSENSVSNVVIEWMVIAERVDSFIKQWDRTNPDGYLITQYTKGPDVAPQTA